MGQSKDSIFQLLEFSKANDQADFCEIVTVYAKHHGGIENTKMFQWIGEPFKTLASDCAPETTKILISAGEYASQFNLHPALIDQLQTIADHDKRYRAPDYIPEKQRPLDEINIKKVEAIISTYGYPGKSLAGDRYSAIVWAVIQHADLTSQEKYLPLIHEAVKKKELSAILLKMFIDRIYAKKTGQQIFGSQAGVAFTQGAVIDSVKNFYSLDRP